MARSGEYTDLEWRPPVSYSPGRPNGPARFIVIHTTEGSSHSQSAEDGAAYDARRTDGTSTHYFVDDTSVIQCVRTTDRAHTAGYTGNLWGVQYELCARASYGRAWWLGGYGTAMLRRAAKQAARDARKYGIPVKRITPADLRAGGKGFVGHVDITYAWGEVDHTDPGPNFPWPEFLAMVNQEMNPTPTPAPAPDPDETEDETMIMPFRIPAGFAYDADGNWIEGNESAISLPLPAVGSASGHASVKSKALFLSLAGDHAGTPVKIRTAINNGAGWTVKTTEVPSGGRVGIPVPAAANGSAFNVTVGRVTTEDAESATLPVSLLVEIL